MTGAEAEVIEAEEEEEEIEAVEAEEVVADTMKLQSQGKVKDHASLVTRLIHCVGSRRMKRNSL